ncbi:MAG: thiamine-phosphate pyrophosphorylase [Candidatus Omnitrophota bacterium]
MPADNHALTDVYKVLDANLNRTKEGLRVCEDIARFHLKSAHLTKRLARLRHRITAISRTSHIDQQRLFHGRDTQTDCGKAFSCGPKRQSFKNIFMANAQRVKEALRVLEEFFKLMDGAASKKIQKLRFDFYAIEKQTIERFPGLLNT